MDWKVFWDNYGSRQDSFHAQVGRIRNDVEIDDETFENVIDSICNYLQPTPNDVILDVCCGNGLITERLTMSCSQCLV